MPDTLSPRYCDIVMKGGITSGIVYPAAVVEIAKDFVFKNVGGTSAGAIAASLTAAAERRRATNGNLAGFERLAKVPDWLAENNHLFRLFQPNVATRGLFRTVVGLCGRPRFKPSFLAKWFGLLWAYPLASAIGAVPGIAFIVRALTSADHSYRRGLDLLLATETLIVGISLGVGIALIRNVLKELPNNAFGLVTGIDDAHPESKESLSTWLSGELESIAGLEVGKVPLSFGMLWDAKRDPQATGLELKPVDPSVNLEMITTNVTWGRPYQFPINTQPFFFDPAELSRFFPAHVIDWMKARSRQPIDVAEQRFFAACAPKLPLPIAADLPVIVATRMSLAFPLLLSAVPLYVAGPAQLRGTAPLEKLWFSDGGISSNFPVTLFDSPLPRWPTFGISLSSFPPGQTLSEDETLNVFLPGTEDAGQLPAVSRFRSLPGFLSAIVDAMQNWNDNTQSRLPGYRDRIATVYLADNEGGLNLDMPPKLLLRLRERGIAAGAALSARFKNPSLCPPNPPIMDWENHRWLRLRTTMSALKEYLVNFRRATKSPMAPDVCYDTLVRADAGLPACEYPIGAAQREAVAQLIDEITERGGTIAKLTTLDDDLPHPTSRLLLRAHLDA